MKTLPSTAEVRLIGFDARYAPDFAALNYQWIEHYFAVEDEDRSALDNPEAYAIEPGGEIFFVLEDDVVVGTVAMVPDKGTFRGILDKAGESKLVFELAKMAVKPGKQGLGYSHILMQACIDFARDKGASEIMLVTNDSLKPALGLYEQAGFIAVSDFDDARYQRGNLMMRLGL